MSVKGDKIVDVEFHAVAARDVEPGVSHSGDLAPVGGIHRLTDVGKSENKVVVPALAEHTCGNVKVISVLLRAVHLGDEVDLEIVLLTVGCSVIDSAPHGETDIAVRGHVGVVAAAVIVESHCADARRHGGGVGASHTGAGQSAAVVFDKYLGVADRSEAVHGVAVVKPQLAVFKIGLNITAGIFPAATAAGGFKQTPPVNMHAGVSAAVELRW